MLQQQGLAESYGNPFGSPFDGATATKEESLFEIPKEEKIDTAREAIARRILATSASIERKARNQAVEELARFFSSVAAEVWSSLVLMAKQAVKMAAFKFAIELCAMSIKSLVEAMLGMKLTPPNIDTKGVYYNFNNTSSQTTQPQQSVSRPLYDNPFGSPFSVPTGW